MAKTKFQINWYQSNDTAAMERKLEKMAEKGWMLEKLTNWGFRYVRSEPQAVRYCVTYFPGASVFDPRPTGGQMAYADYCEAAGWEQVDTWGPMQIFRSTRPDPVPIETDEGEKLEAIHKSMRKTWLFSYLLLLAVWIVNLGLRFGQIRRDPIGFLSSNSEMFFIVFLLVFVCYMLFMVADYALWYTRSKKRVQRGEDCVQPHTRLRWWLSMALLAMGGVLVLSWVDNMRSVGDVLIYVYALGGMALIMFLSQWLMRWMKNRGISRGKARAAFVCAAIVLAVGYSASLIPWVMRLHDADLFEEEKPAEIYVDSHGRQRELYDDELLLTLEDLGCAVSAEDHCTYEAEYADSLLLTDEQFYQRAFGEDSDLPVLGGRVITARWDWVLTMCWEGMREECKQFGREDRSDRFPDALEAFYNPYPYGWCLRYEDRIVVFNWDYTGERPPFYAYWEGEMPMETVTAAAEILRQR